MLNQAEFAKMLYFNEGHKCVISGHVCMSVFNREIAVAQCLREVCV